MVSLARPRAFTCRDHRRRRLSAGGQTLLATTDGLRVRLGEPDNRNPGLNPGAGLDGQRRWLATLL